MNDEDHVAAESLEAAKAFYISHTGCDAEYYEDAGQVSDAAMLTSKIFMDDPDEYDTFENMPVYSYADALKKLIADKQIFPMLFATSNF